MSKRYCCGQRHAKNFVWFYRHGPVPQVPCHWCQKPLEFKEATLDHVIPRSKGGANLKIENLVIACCECNQERNRKEQLGRRKLR